jgi:3-dehydroquinate dehydratase/shikimate dehydrogenase
MIVLSLALRDPLAVRRVLIKPPRGADAVEVRLDFLRTRTPSSWLPSIRQAGKPIIVTCRRKSDGGRFSGGEPERRKILESAAKAGVSYVDIEAGSALCRNLDSYLPARVILSKHWRRTTPSVRELESRASQLARLGPHVIKLVTHASDPSAIKTIKQLLARWDDRPTHLTAFAMGESGKASRIMALAWGSWATYVNQGAGHETAPGQLSLAEACRVYRVGKIDDETRLFGITGDPVAHSLSPLMHNEGFRKLGLNYRYLPLGARSVDSMPDLMDSMKIRGLSVTAPHKVTFFKRLKRLEPEARAIGAVNTILRDSRGLIGLNTDAQGLVRAVSSRIDPSGLDAVILGAGGAARAAAFALAGSGARILISSRRELPGKRLASAVKGEYVDPKGLGRRPYSILVNATPVGSDGRSMPVSGSALKGDLVVDLIYLSGGTPLLQAASARGIETLGGEEVLLEQGFAQFSLFTGCRPPERVMRQAVVRGLLDGLPSSR